MSWNIIQLFDNTDDVLETWTDLFLDVVNKNIPVKEHRVKHKIQPQWISPEILDAIRSRDRHKSLGNVNEYKFWRSKVTKLIRTAKREKYQTFIENNKNKPGSIYKNFKEVGAGKGCQKQSNITSVINSDNKHSEDPNEIANVFNDFLSMLQLNLKNPFHPSIMINSKTIVKARFQRTLNLRFQTFKKIKFSNFVLL